MTVLNYVFCLAFLYRIQELVLTYMTCSVMDMHNTYMQIASLTHCSMLHIVFSPFPVVPHQILHLQALVDEKLSC